MMKRHNPEVYNTTANPSLPRTNSVSAFVIVFVGLGLVLIAAIHWLPRPFRLSAPEIAYFSDHITVSTIATNDTDEATTAQIRVRIYTARVPSEVRPAILRETDHRDVVIKIGRRSTEPMTVSFPVKAGAFANHAELEILSLE